VRKQEFVDFLGRHGIASMHAAQSLSLIPDGVITMPNGWPFPAPARGPAGASASRLGTQLCQRQAEIRFTMALTHEEIANMAGTSRETVTRPAESISPRPVDHHQRVSNGTIVESLISWSG